MQIRETWADYSKAVAITLMVWGHSCLSDNIILRLIYCFHMPIFFIISGYFDNSNQRSLLQTIQKNAKELLLPYLLFSLLGLSICWVLPTAHPELYYYPESIGDIFLSALLGIFRADNEIQPHSFLPVGYAWFLISLFIIRILFAVYQKVLEFSKLSSIVLWIVPTIICIVLFPKLKFVYWFCIDSALMGLPFYIFGYVCKRYSLFSYLKRIPLVLLILSSIIYYYLCMDNGTVGMHTGNYGNHLFFFYLNALLGSLTLIGFTYRLPSSYSRLQWIGRNTLPILLIHIYFVLICKAIYQYVFHLDLSQIPLWLSLVTTGVVIGGCVICIMGYERILKWKKKENHV